MFKTLIAVASLALTGIEARLLFGGQGPPPAGGNGAQPPMGFSLDGFPTEGPPLDAPQNGLMPPKDIISNGNESTGFPYPVRALKDLNGSFPPMPLDGFFQGPMDGTTRPRMPPMDLFMDVTGLIDVVTNITCAAVSIQPTCKPNPTGHRRHSGADEDDHPQGSFNGTGTWAPGSHGGPFGSFAGRGVNGTRPPRPQSGGTYPPLMDPQGSSGTWAPHHSDRNITGTWICRTLYNPVTGKSNSFSACIDADEDALITDQCGCCNGKCPAVCKCACTDNMTGKVGVLVEFTTLPNGNTTNSKCLPSELAVSLIAHPNSHAACVTKCN